MSTAADNTAQKQQIGRPFGPGESGNPAGRPKGSRNKLSEAFLQALADDFDASGKEVIAKVRTDPPHDYLKVCASVMPKRTENEATEHKDVRDMTDAELEAIFGGRIWPRENRLRMTRLQPLSAAWATPCAGAVAITA